MKGDAKVISYLNTVLGNELVVEHCGELRTGISGPRPGIGVTQNDGDRERGGQRGPRDPPPMRAPGRSFSFLCLLLLAGGGGICGRAGAPCCWRGGAGLGASALLTSKVADGSVDALIGLGGTQGTSNATRVMQALPYGCPKVMLSTCASGDTAPFVGVRDITMMFSVSSAGRNTNGTRSPRTIPKETTRIATAMLAAIHRYSTLLAASRP